MLDKKGKILDTSKVISNADLSLVKDIKCCYAFTEKLSNNDTEKYVKHAGFIFWNDSAVKYYTRTSDTLKDLSKNEILKEFEVPFPKQKIWSEKAIEVKQTDNTMYLLGLHPGLLLKIAYVYRRNSNKPTGYQRLVNKERLANIAKFLTSSQDLLLSNPVVIIDK